MRRFDAINLSRKLPIVIVVLAMTAAAITGLQAYFELRKLALLDAEHSLAEVTSARLDGVELWLDEIERNLITLAGSPEMSDVVTQFDTAFAELSSPLSALHDLYITSNPNPTGSKHLLDFADDDSTYSAVHRTFHDFYRTVLERYGYYDIFLVNTEGDIVYTVFKELDFATNLMSGEFAESGLAEAFRNARDLAPGEATFVDFAPYAPSNGAPASFLSAPIYDRGGELVGVLAYQLPSGRLLELISQADGLGQTGEIFLVGSDNLSRAGSRLGTVANVLQPLERIELVGEGEPLESATISDQGVAGGKVLSLRTSIDVFGETWHAITEVSLVEIMQPARELMLEMVAQLIVSSIIIVVLALRISRTITIPVQKIRDGVARVAEGDYDLNMRATDRGDEIGTIAATLMALCDRLKTADRLEREAREEQERQAQVVDAISKSLGALSRGELGCQIVQEFPEEYERLRTDFNATVDELSRTIQAIVEHSRLILRSADEISGSSNDLSHRTESQAATLEETAAAIQELSDSVNAIAEGARQVEKTVDDTRTNAEESGSVVQSAVETMTQIEKSSGQMSQIITVIDDIAFQTNLLALNAGVEAARAGESGRGFAVVAQEVRALAQRSSEAAKEIGDLISSSREQVDAGVTLVGRAGDALSSIIERVTEVSSLVANIASGTVEQAAGLAEVNVGVSSLDQVTQRNAAMVDESKAAARSLKSRSDELVAEVQHFKLSQDQAPDHIGADVEEGFHDGLRTQSAA